ncbi:hypothetical protein RKE30_09040 [Streptomyces sp. Li-HN-5-11]|uniref:hypothetical protein n=1 Tax=Streptomyces sp. Li-HN-5-11 TaxID=3075432 RepID=UPI0028AA471B|nr:hypothetical protein [Streptomyces sp. Li-HN-5-11]WNM30539.1 hypothetical protein RKE30_09040 [Streptomyces sp. Li-HN-5-11]
MADDMIVAGRIILGLKTLRDHLDCSLHEALDAYVARYEVLQRERPADFTKSHEEYWANFHS